MEPDYLAQNGGQLTWDERQEWINARCAEALAAGCIHARASVHPTEPHLVLIEGWKTVPEDEGEPRFQFQAA